LPQRVEVGKLSNADTDAVIAWEVLDVIESYSPLLLLDRRPEAAERLGPLDQRCADAFPIGMP
jgi:hypothetical protein